MGTDIHGVIQIRKDAASKWETIEEEDIGRDYHAFAILANFRYGFGFAGVSTGKGFNFISLPKGLPDDFEIDDDNEHHKFDKVDDGYVWMGEHDHSYLSAKEICEFDYNQLVVQQGYIDEDNYRWRRQCKHKGQPHNYSGGGWGNDLLFITSDEYELLEKSDELDRSKKYNILVEWTHTYFDALGKNFLIHIIKLQQLANQYGNENVRFVFGFDS